MILTPAISHKQACSSTYLSQRIESAMTELRNTSLFAFLSSKETDIDSPSIRGEDMTCIMYYSVRYKIWYNLSGFELDSCSGGRWREETVLLSVNIWLVKSPSLSFGVDAWCQVIHCKLAPVNELDMPLK